MKKLEARDVKDMNLLKHYRIIRKWAAKNNNITDADLELLIYLDCIDLFTKIDFKMGAYSYSWNNRRWNNLLKEGWGIVAGGGVALLNAKKVLAQLKSDNADEATGIQIINKAVEAPLRTIVENSGGEGSVVVSKVSEGKNNFGYNAKEGTYVDMLKEGIIDPKKVTRVALENAASVSGMILTTECALIDIKEDAPAPPPMGGGMPGMM